MSICDCSHRTFESFDDIHFAVMADASSGVYRDWRYQPIYAEEQIPFSNRQIVELIGFTPAVLEWTITFACRHQFHAMIARQGTIGTLRCFADFQSAKGTQISRGNPSRVYEVLDQVLLKSLGDPQNFPDGYVEVSAVFQRAIDPVTRLAVV